MSDHRETATEQIIARDIAAGRKSYELRAALHELRRTIRLRAMRPEDEEAVEAASCEFTDKSAEVLAPYIEALECLREIIYASDGCVGHRQCAHSMEPWQRARKLLYGDGVER